MTKHTKAKNSTAPQPVAKPGIPLHHSLTTMLVFFKKDGTVNQRHFNATLATQAPMVRRDDIDKVIQNVIHRSSETMKIPAEDVVDVIILSISPLGLMTAAEFTGTAPDAKETL